MKENQKNLKLSHDWQDAIITLTDWESVGLKTGKTKYEFVVSVCFNTELDGLLGPVVMVFDPETKELIGYELRY